MLKTITCTKAIPAKRLPFLHSWVWSKHADAHWTFTLHCERVCSLNQMQISWSCSKELINHSGLILEHGKKLSPFDWQAKNPSGNRAASFWQKLKWNFLIVLLWKFWYLARCLINVIIELANGNRAWTPQVHNSCMASHISSFSQQLCCWFNLKVSGCKDMGS